MCLFPQEFLQAFDSLKRLRLAPFSWSHQGTVSGPSTRFQPSLLGGKRGYLAWDQGVLSSGCPRQLPCSSSSELRERSGWQEGTPGCLASYRALHTSRTGLLVSVIVPWELG